jgi:hypothetical protein
MSQLNPVPADAVELVPGGNYILQSSRGLYRVQHHRSALDDMVAHVPTAVIVRGRAANSVAVVFVRDVASHADCHHQPINEWSLHVSLEGALSFHQSLKDGPGEKV